MKQLRRSKEENTTMGKTEALNVATVAAWRIRCFIEKSPLNQLEFRRHIALSLLQSDGSAPLEAVASPVIRFDVFFVQDQRDVVKYAYERTERAKKCNARLHAEWDRKCFDIYSEIKSHINPYMSTFCHILPRFTFSDRQKKFTTTRAAVE
ncbi:hypothetical protein Tsp_09072 [Trichinella spiralis]|uniref:hypothetical protein n=1 Tax=Trichinella spiralis TaxID=6334 RepID=UPI0001EFC79A|nr:hypothetical protein Tsp_09072 [Trichinella spiralis]